MIAHYLRSASAVKPFLDLLPRGPRASYLSVYTQQLYSVSRARLVFSIFFCFSKKNTKFRRNKSASGGSEIKAGSRAARRNGVLKKLRAGRHCEYLI